MYKTKVCLNKSVTILLGVALLLVFGVLAFAQLSNRQTSTNTRASERTRKNTAIPTPTVSSVIQNYSNTVKKDTSGYGGECQVSSDCMPPDVCIGKKINNKVIGSCVPPAPTSILQQYFDTVKKDRSGYGGECQVSSDCMPPDVCILRIVNDKIIGTCVKPTPTK
jgi:hypothetical protein